MTEPNEAGRLRVVLADDAPLMRQGVAFVLAEAGIDVVAQAGDAAGLLSAVAALHPDLVVSDIRMPPGHGTEGLDAAVTIAQQHPDVGILLLSNHAETRHLSTLLESAGAGVGYLLKERVVDTDAFVAAVRRIAAGGTALDPEIVTLLLARQQQRRVVQSLTERERQVLQVMATGASNAAVGATLHLAGKTVEAHIQHIFGKLGLSQDPDEHRRVKAVLTYLQGL